MEHHAGERTRTATPRTVGGPAPPVTGRRPVEEAGKPCLWQAWTGPNPMPAYLELCRESVRRHNERDFTVVLITPDNLHRYLDDVHPAYEHLSYVHRADYLRCELLHRRGGVYLDVDTVCTRSLAPWLDPLADHDLVGYDGSTHGELFGVGAFGPTRPGSVLTRAWSRRLHERLDLRLPALEAHRRQHPDPRRDALGWGEILRDVLLPLSLELDAARRLSLHTIDLDRAWLLGDHHPVERLFEPAPIPVPPSAEIVILNNALYPAEFKTLTRQQVLDADVALARLVRSHALA